MGVEAAEISKLSLGWIVEARRWKCVLCARELVSSSQLKQQHTGVAAPPPGPGGEPGLSPNPLPATATRASQHCICSISEKSPARRLSAHRRSLELGGGKGMRGEGPEAGAAAPSGPAKWQ